MANRKQTDGTFRDSNRSNDHSFFLFLLLFSIETSTAKMYWITIGEEGKRKQTNKQTKIILDWFVNIFPN